MKNIFVLIAVCFCSSAFAYKEGGGGSGCLANFMRSAYKTAQWLEAHGKELTPQVSADDFMVSIDPSSVKTTTKELTYNGNSVDAYFDGQFISIRCDRLNAVSEESSQRVIAHEIFRKMGLEGDAYEISRQIWPEGNKVPKVGDRLYISTSLPDGQTGIGVSNFGEGLQRELLRPSKMLGDNGTIEIDNPDLNTAKQNLLKLCYERLKSNSNDQLILSYAWAQSCKVQSGRNEVEYEITKRRLQLQIDTCEALCTTINLGDGSQMNQCKPNLVATVIADFGLSTERYRSNVCEKFNQ